MIVLVWVLGAAGLLIAGWYAAGSFTRASPQALASALRLFLASFAAMAGMGLLAFGRLGVLAALVGAVALTAVRLARQRRPPDPLEEADAAGQSSVETAWLAMRLDRASGQLSGQVRQGRFAGRVLASLDLAELLLLREELAVAEPASLPLIETWLDRMAPDWRQGARSGAYRGTGATAGTGEMDETTALEVLGLQPGAGRAEIEAAYRRVMAKVHPDKGGSDRLASLVNAAREYLLNRS
ncbi:J domain-containing protein [Geminicoccus flavidas]|uniref:J domain-containing protein n=1 Tax=Geminicoccus flavidas TaxID=2506407 RepID=UPI0013582F7E|nr:DnaJ domain-containing protein [Geminicoccus flavidas]